jgi:hypothetical protein
MLVFARAEVVKSGSSRGKRRRKLRKGDQRPASAVVPCAIESVSWGLLRSRLK